MCGAFFVLFFFKRKILSNFNGSEFCEDSWSQFVWLLYYLKAKAHKRKNKAQLLIVLATLWILMITMALCIKFLQKGRLLLTLFYNFSFSRWLLLPLRTFVRSFSECHYILTEIHILTAAKNAAYYSRTQNAQKNLWNDGHFIRHNGDVALAC